MADHQYNPVAEIPQEALAKAAEDWGNKPLDKMKQESERLGLELKQINDQGVMKSPILGGPDDSVEDKLSGMTQRIAAKHFLTQKIGEVNAQERQLKAMVANMTAADNLLSNDPDIDPNNPGIQHALDPLGYERDRGLNHVRSASLFGTFLAHAGEKLEGLQRNYDSVDQSPLVQALRQGLTLPMPFCTRAELSHATLTTSAGVTAERAPDRRRVDKPTRMPELLDYIPMEMEPRAIYTYIEEVKRSDSVKSTTSTTPTDGSQADDAAVAAVKAEGAASSAEATLQDVRREVSIPLVEVNIPVTYEQLMNTMRARRIIDEKLPMMMEQKVDAAALTALVGLSGALEIEPTVTGTSPNRVVSNAADVILEAIITEVYQKGYTNADMALLQPEYYVRFLTEQSSSGGYLIRSSSELSPVRTAWGLPVALATSALAYGTTDDIAGVIGDFGNYSVLAYAEESGFRVLDQHGTDALAMSYRFQAWWRAIVAYLRPVAFCRIKIT